MGRKLPVCVDDGNGNILESQPYNEYQYGLRSQYMISYYRGGDLINILVNELGKISFDGNKLILKQVLSEDLGETASRLLGNIAEAVLVRRCKEDPELNWKLFMLARRKKAWGATAQRFRAIGTGLLSTKEQYLKRYSHSDKQRDIIWVDSEGNPALMNGSSYMSGIEAGIQVKVSRNGVAYVAPDIINNQYEVPVVYFPLNNDYEEVIYSVMKRHPKVQDPDTNEYRSFLPEDDLVDIRAYDYDSFEEVKDYSVLVYALLNGDLTVHDLVEKYSTSGIIKSAIMHSALEKIDSSIIV